MSTHPPGVPLAAGKFRQGQTGTGDWACERQASPSRKATMRAAFLVFLGGYHRGPSAVDDGGCLYLKRPRVLSVMGIRPQANSRHVQFPSTGI